MVDSLLYWVARGLIGFLQLWPLRWVARFGRGCGGLAYRMDVRHRRVALENLTRCFGATLDGPAIRALALENFKRLGENYACAVKTSGMTDQELQPHLEWSGFEALREAWTKPALDGATESGRPGSLVFAIGHFGNFELYARPWKELRKCRIATTYRGLRQPGLDRLMQSLRTRSGCVFFERRRDGAALRQAMAEGSLFLGLLADQHAGDGGLWLPFMGTECSTSAAPAVLAQRYGCPLYTAICYRVRLGQWRVEMGPLIPTLDGGGQRRSAEEVMREVNTAFEKAVRRDPANWFWVHKRWKPRKRRPEEKNPRADESL